MSYKVNVIYYCLNSLSLSHISSASSPVFNRINNIVGVVESLDLASIGGFGMHTRDTLFFPILLIGIDSAS